MMTPEQTNQLLRNRRSIYPKMFNDLPISDEMLWELLENANYAPTHRLTEPWRFKVFRGEAKLRLGRFLAETYRNDTPSDKFKEEKYKKPLKNAEKSDAIVVICVRRDPNGSVPFLEETNAVACAVQNIWLSAHAYGIGTYWSSPAAVYTPAMNEFLGLPTDDLCMGLMYMGFHDLPQLPAKRTPIQDKVEWITE